VSTVAYRIGISTRFSDGGSNSRRQLHAAFTESGIVSELR
jgi:hypothetical protein